ncbi:MAG: biotin--[acetyl-CoA-carboxylase] ligase [Thermodesulfobacteriota bacterium]|nr:biotin--[acetyl-CoA-carboxylase] ligase [Thermodesulfobacteriota bacterium]
MVTDPPGSCLAISAGSSLSPQAVRQGLDTRCLGRQGIHCFDLLPSTNSEAKRLALRGAPEGTIVLAETQSRGRGRLRRHWASPSGKGLYLSVILRPQVPPEWGARTTLVAGVALAVAIEQLGIRPSLKWPNDVMMGHRKVAGILTEASFQENRMASIVVGVGVNVNAREEDFPPSIRELATSLRLSAGRSVPRLALLQRILCQLEAWYGLLCQGAFERILETWRDYESILDSLVEVSLPGSRLLGMAEDIDPDGRLLVRDSRGRLHRIMAGDVVHCRSKGRNSGWPLE